MNENHHTSPPFLPPTLLESGEAKGCGGGLVSRPMGIAHLDYCRVQRLVNNWGGADEFPAYPTTPVWDGDRLTQYGFDLGHLSTPTDAGCYALVMMPTRHHILDFVGSEHLMYIGSAKNIKRRIESAGHWYGRLHKRFGGDVLARFLVTDDHLTVERSLIRTLRPWLNIHHNG